MMTSVLIAGGMPVGMTLALDLSSRGIDRSSSPMRPPMRSRASNAARFRRAPWKSFAALGSLTSCAAQGFRLTIRTTSSATSVLGRAFTRVDSRAGGARNGGRGGTRHAVANAPTHAPGQPEILRAGAVRSRGGTTARSHTQSHRGRQVHAGRPGRMAIVRNLDKRTRDVDRLLVPGGLRRRQLDGA